MATNKQAKLKAPAKTAAKKELSVANYVMLMVAITVLVVAAGGYFGYLMIKENIRNGQVLVGKVKAQSDVKKKLENANTLVENYAQMSDQDKELIQAALPSNPDFTQLMSLMETAGSSAGTKMKSISYLAGDIAAAPAAPAPTDAVTTASDTSGQQPALNAPASVKASATIDGNYSQFTQYFRNLELSVRPIRIQTFSLKGNSGSLKGDITLETFYQNPADYSDKEEVVK